MRCCLKHTKMDTECDECNIEMSVIDFAATPAFYEQIAQLQVDCLTMYQRLNRMSIILEILKAKGSVDAETQHNNSNDSRES